MNTPPKMVSTKDLSYITDMINWNMTICKCSKHYESKTQIEDITKMMQTVYEMHKRHIETLLNLLKENTYEQ